MEKTIRQLAGELRARGALEQNLPLLMNQTASAYGRLSLYNLAMELAMFLESEADGRIAPDKEVKELMGTMISSIKEELLDASGQESGDDNCRSGGYDPEKNRAAIEELTALREYVERRMESLTAYTDLFTLYEYIMNRLEPKFEQTQEIAGEIDNDTVAREVLQWIFSDEEPGLINERIKETLSCLPVRMTKGKFLELVERAFALYKEADRSSIDLFDYMLRNASGLYTSEGMREQFPQLENIRNVLEEMAVSVPTKEAYQTWKQQLSEGIAAVRSLTECYDGVQAIANAFLTVLLTKPYFTLEAEQDSTEAAAILQQMCAEQNADSETLFAGLEHKMEKLSEEVTLLEPLLSLATEKMSSEISELMLTAVHQRLLAAQRLNSGSMYAGLLPEEEKELPEGYLEQVKSKFITEIKEVFSNGSRQRNRAVMAAVLKELPVYFNSHTEVMDYVRSSLEQCHDEGEKKISIELLRSCYV